MLKGQKFLVTAGPTVEAIDPVRFISNHSTGKMGYAIAAELAARGAEVTLVSGPVALPVPAGVRRVDVVSAEDMYRECVALWPSVDGAVMCAAVADYTPAFPAASKIKKEAGGVFAGGAGGGTDDAVGDGTNHGVGGETTDGAGDTGRIEGTISLVLRPTKDIAAELGRTKLPGQLLVGFALETDDEQTNALGKMERKNLDIIVLNSLRDPGAGFGGDTNRITIFERSTAIAAATTTTTTTTAPAATTTTAPAAPAAAAYTTTTTTAPADPAATACTAAAAIATTATETVIKTAYPLESKTQVAVGEIDGGVIKTTYPLESKLSAAVNIVDRIEAILLSKSL
jgi:phosphopantothenoylcysteine decarboxylase/phosphopantothenate--cysteine ligase